MIYSKTQIIQVLKKEFTNAQFYVTPDGSLTMSLDGQYVDHKWKKGTYTNN